MTAPRTAFVWALAHPLDVKHAEGAIAAALRRILRASDPERHSIHVSESSGWITYTDRAQLWRANPPGRLPASASEARAHAEHFLRELARALDEPSARRQAPSLDGLALFPPLEHRGTVVVASAAAAGWDHWLYRAQPSLPLDGRRHRAPIFGSQFEVRIGDGGRIASYTARYRPVTAEHVVAEVPAFMPDAVHTHGHGHPSPPPQSEDKREPPIVYLQEGDGIPQHYLSPYFLVDDGHMLALGSASSWSLVVSLEVSHLDEGLRATAAVAGGSGDYAFDWGVYEIDATASGHREFGAGSTSLVRDSVGRSSTVSTISLAAGAYIVLLNVKDRRTGAFKHHQEQVFANVPMTGIVPLPVVKL